MEGGDVKRMILKWIGALIIIASCGSFGVILAIRYRSEIAMLESLEFAFTQMRSEIEYRLTPLPSLCRLTAELCGGMLSKVLRVFSDELDGQATPDVHQCMQVTLNAFPSLPPISRDLLLQFGITAGRYDLEGQVTGVGYLQQVCSHNLAELRKNRDARFRNYQTLGLCAGAALAILFI